MPAGSSDALVRAVGDIKAAIQNAQLQTPDVIITQADLELRATLTGGPNASFQLGPVQIGAKYTWSQIQTLTMTLTPVPKLGEMLSPASDALTDGIVAISIAARQAAASEPTFGLVEATVELNFGTDADGCVTFLVGAEAEQGTTHTLRLTIKKRP